MWNHFIWTAIFRHKEAFKKLEQLGMHVKVLPNSVENDLLAFASLRFHHCPPVLVLQLKRFQYTRWSRERLNNPVSFPLQNLDLSPYLTVQSWVATSFPFFPRFFQQLPSAWEASARETSTVNPVPSQDGLPTTFSVAFPVWLFRSMTLQQCLNTLAHWVVVRFLDVLPVKGRYIRTITIVSFRAVRGATWAKVMSHFSISADVMPC